MKKLKQFLPYILTLVVFIYCEMAMNGTMGLSVSHSTKGLLVPICCWVVMAVSLNLVVGISGELSLGHAGFMSVGCFTGIVVSSWLVNAGVHNLALRVIITFAASGFFAMIAGFIIGIPVLRLKGDYLAIVTLAFGEIIRSIMNCLYVSIDGTHLYFGFLNNKLPGKGIVNGSASTKLLAAVKEGKEIVTPAVKIGTEDGFIIGILLIIFTLIVVLNLVHSRSGRAIMSVRDNVIAAESSGVDVMKYRLMAFVVSAVLAGMAGSLYGLSMPIDPSKFRFDQSITVLVFVVMGGIGNMTGSMIAATVLTILPEKLRSFSNYRMLAYAILLIVMMLVTNNPTIRSWLNVIKAKFTKRGKEAG